MSNVTNTNRIHSLDHLRGVMACAIMFYHYSSWTFGDFESDTILGRIGVYGVSIFYILSGLTLYIVYHNSLVPTLDSLRSFCLKRVFRIYLLLWIVTILWVLAPSSSHDYWTIVLNLSGLFGFLQPSAYIGTGVWSIGNELVFYALFPGLIFLEKFNTKLFYVAVALAFGTAVAFAFLILKPDQTLENQWSSYINPFNQFFLFSGGVMIGHALTKVSFSINPRISYTIILSLILIFCLYPATGNLINIVTGINRIIFSLVGFMLCTVVFLDKCSYPRYVSSILSFLGQCSYSVYLLHLIIYKVTDILNVKIIACPAGLFDPSQRGINVFYKLPDLRLY